MAASGSRGEGSSAGVMLGAGALGGLTPESMSAEMESIRSLRRRSLSTSNDPDLPSSARSPPLPPSPTLSSPPTSPSEAVDLPFSHSFAKAAPPVLSSDSDTPLPLSDLMWLPAHLHPDVAPQEFRAFLAEQTKPEALMRRSGSLNRKKSMLSKQYTPSSSESSPVERPPTPPPVVEGAARKKDPLENLTIEDLQRLEQLAVQAATDGDKADEGKEHFQDLLRRSMSTGPAVEVVDADSQPLVQAPGGLIRRTARTKIRKTTLEGDGGGHRFGPSRRVKRRDSTQSAESSPVESPLDGVSPIERRASFTSSEDLHDEPPASPTRLPPPSPTKPTLLAAPVARPPRAPSPGTDDRPLTPSFDRSPPPSPAPPVAPPINVAAPPPSPPAAGPSSKKSGWARLVGKSSSPKVVEEDDDASDTASLASTSSKRSVFSSLFRKKEDSAPREMDLPPQQMAISPTASGMLGKNGKYTNFYRLPIHVERAVYRLSHIKLANPRRPLLEQVLISNLMFWYLGVINRPVTQLPNQPAPPPGMGPEPTLRMEPPSREASPPPPSAEPALPKRPEREKAPIIIREPQPRREAAFEVLHRQTASHPTPGKADSTSEWINSWPKGQRQRSPVNGDIG